MGENKAQLFTDQKNINRFVHALISDIKALEYMLKHDMIESDVQRIGAEQEVALLDRSYRPGHLNIPVLERLEGKQFTTEHSQYNLEINFQPLLFQGDCLSRLENNIQADLAELQEVLEDFEAHVALVGILPTIRRSDLALENLTPLPRYHVLNEVMNRVRGGPYEFRIEGKDELITQHDSIMFEGCNTSFQVHLQIPAHRFVDDYNWAQMITAPVLAAATNSPLLLGKRLWQETRIALFQQSVDTRRSDYGLREVRSRITFGSQWLSGSPTEFFKRNITRYRTLIAMEVPDDSFQRLQKGEIPPLKALSVHNGNVYRWNRPCYGVTEGKPHLRIENRVIPSGPTLTDEVANAAFWLGLMNGKTERYQGIDQKMEFGDVKNNFAKAARYGLESQFVWLDGRTIPTDQLILDELLPLASEGLARAGINASDIGSYLGVIEARVRTRQTGSKWILQAFDHLKKGNSRYEAAVALTAGMVSRQKSGEPVHTWSMPDLKEAGDWINRYWYVEQIMDTDLFTVQPEDSIVLASTIMAWKGLRYLPVEDGDGNLAGLLTTSRLLNHYSTAAGEDKDVLVKSLMIKKPRAISPDMLSIDAVNHMRQEKIGCLPVLDGKKLVGLITEKNFMNFSEELIQALLKRKEELLYG